MKKHHYVYESCVGCGACSGSCPIDALKIEKNEDGFLRAVKQDNCIECRLCLNFCLSRTDIKNSLKRNIVPHTYVAWSKEKIKNNIGNSGGLFFAFGKEWIENGGVVAATAYEENFVPRFRCAKTIEDLKKQAWSKFVQSETGDIFNEVKYYVNAQISVLFVGAPCQVKGLYTYLGGDNKYLLTVQFPCIGMPPQWFYQEYLKDFTGCSLSQLNTIYGEVLADKSEKRKMICTAKDGTVKSELADKSLFVRAWNSFFIVDDVCCRCCDNIAPVCADLTWGNFWYLGVLEKFDIPSEQYENGFSMLLVNSIKGENAVKKMLNRIVIYKRTYREAQTGHTMFQYPAEEHLIMRRYVKSDGRVRFQKAWKEKNFLKLKEEFFNSSDQARSGFALARIMNKKTKALIWRFLYYVHKFKRLV